MAILLLLLLRLLFLFLLLLRLVVMVMVVVVMMLVPSPVRGPSFQIVFVSEETYLLLAEHLHLGDLHILLRPSYSVVMVMMMMVVVVLSSCKHARGVRRVWAARVGIARGVRGHAVVLAGAGAVIGGVVVCAASDVVVVCYPVDHDCRPSDYMVVESEGY